MIHSRNDRVADVLEAVRFCEDLIKKNKAKAKVKERREFLISSSWNNRVSSLPDQNLETDK
jgi:hypothetical protein